MYHILIMYFHGSHELSSGLTPLSIKAMANSTAMYFAFVLLYYQNHTNCRVIGYSNYREVLSASSLHPH